MIQTSIKCNQRGAEAEETDAGEETDAREEMVEVEAEDKDKDEVVVEDEGRR